MTVDFQNPVGKIKPMHGTNMGPRQGFSSLSMDFTKEFLDIGIPYARLHDVEYPYGSNQYVDIHCIFPDFSADENDPASYHFTSTDKYLRAIAEVGSQVFYRLGESIDHFPHQLYVHPPKDAAKWARICEHIIRHYNEGWANGFHMGIEYWEIWNEPDNEKLWAGTKEAFFELYRVTANHLKACFGDSIKVGGCGFSGFYMNNRENASRWFKTLVPYMHDFFGYITAEETRAPMDFFTWHCYAESPEEVALHAVYARDMLRQYHMEHCESILDEFNMFYCFSEYTPYHKGGFADLAASLVLAQKSEMDMMMHYCIFPRGTYNNLFNLDIDGKTVVRFAGLESFASFNALYRLGTEVKTTGDVPEKLHILAATDGERKGILLVSRGFAGDVTLRLNGGEDAVCSIKQVDDSAGRGQAHVESWEGTVSSAGELVCTLDGDAVVYIAL